MPSSKKPLTTVQSSAGKLHSDIATASSQLFPEGAGQEQLLSFLNAAAQREIAYVKRTASVAAAGQGSFDLRAVETDPIWVSDNPADDIENLFQVVDENGDPPKVVGDPGATVTLITGPTIGDGFITGPITLNFSSALPASGSFQIWYSIRRQNATVEKDADTSATMRRTRLDPVVVQQRLEELHATTVQAWDDSWDATIEALATAGLNERYRRSTSVGGAATGVLNTISTVNVLNGDTVKISTKTYTFQAALTDFDGNVHIGPTLALSLENLRRAINLEDVAGVDYAASMTLHPTVLATNTAVRMYVTAKAGGTAGNSITTSDTSASLQWDRGTLFGGVDFFFNRPGSGNVISRDGLAPTVVAGDGFHTYGFPNGFVEPTMAHWLCEIEGDDTFGGFASQSNSGGAGFVSLGSARATDDLAELCKLKYSVGSHVNLMLRNLSASTLNTADTRTRVEKSVSCSLNPLAGVTSDAKREIDVGVGNFFQNASGNTEISVGYDMVRIVYTGALVDRTPEMYVITDIISPTRIRVRSMMGGRPEFTGGITITDCTLQLVKMAHHQGGGAAPFNEIKFAYPDPPLHSTAMYHAVLPAVTDDPPTAGEVIPKPARFLAAAQTANLYQGVGTEAPKALEWGGFDATLTTPQVYPGALRGDGGVNASIYKQGVRSATVSASGPTTTTWHPGKEGSLLVVVFTHAAGIATWTLTIDPNYDPVVGEKLEVLLLAPTNAPPGGVAEVGITWPAAGIRTFIFDAASKSEELFINEELWLEATHVTDGISPFFLCNLKNYKNQVVTARSFRTESHNIVLALGGGAFSWRPMVSGGYVEIDIQDAGGYTMTLTAEAPDFPLAGTVLYIEVLQTGVAGGTITWPGNFTFSGGDAAIPPAIGDRVLYRALYTISGDWLLTRTDY